MENNMPTDTYAYHLNKNTQRRRADWWNTENDEDVNEAKIREVFRDTPTHFSDLQTSD